MDRCRGFRLAHDRQVDRRMQIAAGAAHLEIPEAGIQRVSEHRGRPSGPLKTQHPVRPGFAGQDVSLTPGLAGTLRRCPDGRGVEVFPGLRTHAGKVARHGGRIQPLRLVAILRPTPTKSPPVIPAG